MKTTKLNYLFTIIAVVIAFSLIFIGLQPEFFLTKSKEFDSLNELATELVKNIDDSATDNIYSMIIDKREYAASIHPYTPEGKDKDAIDGAQFFEIFIEQQRDYSIIKTVEAYNNRINRIISIGSPSDTISTSKFKILRKIPLTLEMFDDEKQLVRVENNQILGAVIERNGKYRLLNIFFD